MTLALVSKHWNVRTRQRFRASLLYVVIIVAIGCESEERVSVELTPDILDTIASGPHQVITVRIQPLRSASDGEPGHFATRSQFVNEHASAEKAGMWIPVAKWQDGTRVEVSTNRRRLAVVDSSNIRHILESPALADDRRILAGDVIDEHHARVVVTMPNNWEICSVLVINVNQRRVQRSYTARFVP